MQSWLAQSTSLFVNAKVADHILAWAQATLKTAVRRNLEEPEKHFQTYGDVILIHKFLMIMPLMVIFITADILSLYFAVDKYDWLVNGTAQTQMEKFMREEHSFDEYTQVTNN